MVSFGNINIFWYNMLYVFKMYYYYTIILYKKFYKNAKNIKYTKLNMTLKKS